MKRFTTNVYTSRVFGICPGCYGYAGDAAKQWRNIRFFTTGSFTLTSIIQPVHYNTEDKWVSCSVLLCKADDVNDRHNLRECDARFAK